MDPRTARLLEALKDPGAALLLRLLEGPATEAVLLGAESGAAQATANRRLARLEELSLIERDEGEPHTPGRTWRLKLPDEVDALLSAATDLSAALARQENERREQLRGQLRRARKRRGSQAQS